MSMAAQLSTAGVKVHLLWPPCVLSEQPGQILFVAVSLRQAEPASRAPASTQTSAGSSQSSSSIRGAGISASTSAQGHDCPAGGPHGCSLQVAPGAPHKAAPGGQVPTNLRVMVMQDGLIVVQRLVNIAEVRDEGRPAWIR